VLLRNYQRGRKIHWSGFSSASLSREVALSFAGAGGVLLRLDLLPQGSRARDIRELSMLRGEEEASGPTPTDRFLKYVRKQVLLVALAASSAR
jgi:hypothetical protein